MARSAPRSPIILGVASLETWSRMQLTDEHPDSWLPRARKALDAYLAQLTIAGLSACREQRNV